MATPAPTFSESRPERGALPSLGAGVTGVAAYLGCSWTWCIGMFLPVLLIRDFGMLGYVVFAAPNVVGAGAMGWVLSREGQSEAFCARHLAACRWFSIVTALFQCFFLCTLARVLLADAGMVWVAGVVGGVVVCLATGWFTIVRPRLAPLVLWPVSAALLLAAWGMRGFGWSMPAALLARTDVFWLAPVCVFGFLLCPYLDLTFHRARQSTGAAAARRTFTLGFGGFFFMMILGTLTYAPLALDALGSGGQVVRSAAVWLVAAHIGLQLGNTIGSHLGAEFGGNGAGLGVLRGGRSRATLLGLGVFCLVAMVISLPSWFTWESLYRSFMAFYGLVFPAYIWICALPLWGSAPAPAERRRRLAVFAAAVVVATPAFWMGFIERETWWLGPGLAVVLAARLFVPRTGSSRAASRASEASTQ